MVDPLRNIRKLTAFLVISGTVNIILIGLVFYWAVSERPPTPYYELKPANKQEQQAPLASERSDSEVIRYFRRMPLQWLISRLNNKQLVENGYTQRDLALASLVAFHYFDLDRAFSGLTKPEETRRIVYGKFSDGRSAELIVYPGLSDRHFEAIRSFAATERWPLTSRGLFLALQKEEKEDEDLYLLDAFFMTSEFSTIEMLFSRNEVAVTKEELLKVLLEGNWNRLSEFVVRQKISHDLSQARRQHFLLEYARNKSKAAAQLILKTDGDFAARKLDDQQIMMLLQLVDEKSQQAKQFALTLLKSPRSDAVRKLATERLSEYGGNVIAEAHPKTVLASFAHTNTTPPQQVKTTVAVKTITPPKPMAQQSSVSKSSPVKNKDFFYVVKEGDSLWKIGRCFRVDIEVLRAFNQLETDALYPGMSLRIPR